MADPNADLSEQIAQAAADPASVSSDGQSVTARGTEELIRADQHLAQRQAGRRPLRGIAITRLIAPGALDDSGRGANFDQGGY
jgi:hypothetical protein